MALAIRLSLSHTTLINMHASSPHAHLTTGPKRPRVHSNSRASSTKPFVQNGPKRPKIDQSASHSSLALGLDQSVQAHRSRHSVSSESATSNDIIIRTKRAKTCTPSTAAARGIVLPLGPKLAGRFPSARDDAA